MAMFTEGDQDDSGHAPNTTTATAPRGQTRDSQHTRDSVGNFVGRVQKSKKRQSIAELNESITESNFHMQSLCQQAQSLRNQSHRQKNTNIMYQLELIRKQQEELLKLQRELQTQLQMEAESSEVEGQPYNQWAERGQGSTLDAQVSDLISSSERMLTLHSEESLTQNLESIQEEEKNNNDLSFTIKSPVNRSISKQEDKYFSRNLAPKTFFETPWTPEYSQSVPSHSFTPSLQSRIHDAQSNIPLIQSPKPLKPAPPVEREEGAKSPSPPPIWTPMALKSEAERQTTPDLPSTPRVKRRLDQDADYAISCEEPMDLSTRSVMESSVDRVPVVVNKTPVTSCISTSATCGSSPKAFHSSDIGSLSLRANSASSPLITHNTPSHHRSSRLIQSTQEIPLYKEVLSIANEQRYREALLDDECARYCCRLQAAAAAQPRGFWFNRGYVNPVATVLSHGDEMVRSMK